MKANQVLVEEVTLKPVGDSRDIGLGYHVTINGERSPLYFSPLAVAIAIQNALIAKEETPFTTESHSS